MWVKRKRQSTSRPISGDSLEFFVYIYRYDDDHRCIIVITILYIYILTSRKAFLGRCTVSCRVFDVWISSWPLLARQVSIETYKTTQTTEPRTCCNNPEPQTRHPRWVMNFVWFYLYYIIQVRFRYTILCRSSLRCYMGFFVFVLREMNNFLGKWRVAIPPNTDVPMLFFFLIQVYTVYTYR